MLAVCLAVWPGWPGGRGGRPTASLGGKPLAAWQNRPGGTVRTWPAAVLIAWRAAADSAGEPERLPRTGMAAGALVWAGAAGWELTALALQPTLGTDSPAHPTLSYLANPVLASVPGRPAVLFAWLALGWYLARR